MSGNTNGADGGRTGESHDGREHGDDEPVGLSRRTFVRGSILAGAAVAGGTKVPNGSANDYLTSNRAPLQQTPFVRLPLGSVTARGWLGDQLERQRDGLTGAAGELYDAVSDNSAWLGGTGEDWEQGPYYVKGLLPLAYLLDDASLIGEAEKWVNGFIDSQESNGDFGPTDDWWPRMIVLFIMRDYYEATGDGRVIPFLTNYFQFQQRELPNRPLEGWGQARAGDNIDVVLWLYNITGDSFLLDLADTLRQQALPWSQIHTDNLFYDSGYQGSDTFHPHHVVNVAQGLKFPSVVWQQSGDAYDREAMQTGIDHLMRQYGRIDGQFSGSEMLSEKSSTAGVELCADVERMLSQAIATRNLGDATLADQMEKVAYNSLPAHTSPSMKQISYYQIPNQVESEVEPHGFTEDHSDALMRSPHSGFPCCNYNWHHGWPKFVQNLWAGTNDNGLAAIAYGPSEVTTTVGSGTQVTVVEETGYPFRETIDFTVSMAGGSEQFPIRLRVPQWADSARIEQGSTTHTDLQPGAFYTLDQNWSDGDTFRLVLPMDLRTSRWINDSIGIERGPLAFNLDVDEHWELYDDHYQDFDGFEVFPTSDWNYALDVDTENPAEGVDVTESAFNGSPFSRENAPVTITASGEQVPGWGMQTVDGNEALAQEPPHTPATTGTTESLTLTPYGAGNLRISYFPEVDDTGRSASASYTYDTDSPAEVIDGVISYDNDPENRWTGYQSPNDKDWVSVDYTEEQTFDGLTVYVYDDGGGVQSPADLDVWYQDGDGDWHQAPNQSWSPSTPAAGENTVTFDSITTDTINVDFYHADPANDVYSGATEIEYSIQDGGDGGSITEGTYRIENVNSGLALDVSGVSTDDGANVHQWEYAGGENQHWQVIENGDGTYRLEAVHSGKVLDMEGNSTDNGTTLVQWAWADVDWQRWNIIDNGDGTYRLENVYSGKVADVEDVSSADGADVQQWDWVGGDNQRWNFIEL